MTNSGWVPSTNEKTRSKLNQQIRARIAKRLVEGWSLEKIGQRTVWTMYGHLYSIKNGVGEFANTPLLHVKMNGGTEVFGPVQS